MKVFIISGPTASGKTGISIDLCKSFNGEVINFDSLLFYSEINIGTAKPNHEELKLVPHHLINIRSIANPVNAFEFSQLCLPIIEEVQKRSKNIFLVGGSGFYLQAVLNGMYDSPTTPQEILKKSDDLYKQEGILPFIQILKEHDPQSLIRYHHNDHYRIRRAVEHWWSHGSSFTESREVKTKENFQLKNGNRYGWDLHHIYLNIPKPDHEGIIKLRTKTMLENGLIEEVRSLIEMGFSPDLKPLQSIGYKETIDFLNHKIQSIEELEERINISTRQLAKAQRTWFNRVKNKIEFNPQIDRLKIEESIIHFLKT